MSKLNKILEHVEKNLKYRSSDEGAIERTALGKLGDVRSVLDFGARNDGRDPSGTHAAIQSALDVLKENRGGGLYFPEGTYVIDRPLLLQKNRDPGYPDDIEEEYNNWIHLIGHGAIIRRSDAFAGDRLLTILADSGDKEESIIIEGLVFNGLSWHADGHPIREVIGVDFFDLHVPYDTKHPTYPPAYGYPSDTDDPAYKVPSAYSKHVNFTKCIFTMCYIGVRLHGTCHSFVQCQFRGNHCGTFITPAANDMRFTNCSFRVGGVGADITAGTQSGQENWGTTGIGFYGCIFEGNSASGIRSRGSTVSVHGGYFEKNGYNYAANLYDLSDQDDSIRMGAAIHKETGKATGSMHIHGAYFSYEKLYANSFLNCFVECAGDLTVIPRKYGNYPDGPWAHCPFGSTFIHGPARLQIIDADDVRDGDRFTLNDEEKIIATATAEKYTEAPLSEVTLFQPFSVACQVARHVTIPYPAEPAPGTEKEPLPILSFEFWEHLRSGRLDLTVSMAGFNSGGNYSHAATMKKGYFFFRSNADDLFTVVPDASGCFANTTAQLSASNTSRMGGLLNNTADLQLSIAGCRATLSLVEWINPSVPTLGNATSARYSLYFDLSGQVDSAPDNISQLLKFD